MVTALKSMKKDKNQQQFEKWAMPKLKELQKVLLLEHFHPLKLEFGCENKGAHAECNFTFPYQSITINYSEGLLKDFQKKDYEGVFNVLTHEMCHPLTDPLYAKALQRYVTKDEIQDEREKLTDHIANVVLKLTEHET